MYNNFSQEQYIRSLQNLKNEAEQRLQQAMQYQPAAINQTFQLAPTQYTNNEYDGRKAKNIEEVRNTLALKDTLFINDEKDTLWLKDAGGNIKTYNLQEVIELDEKDKKIYELQKQIEELKGVIINEQSNTFNANGTVESAKPANVPTDKSIKKQ